VDTRATGLPVTAARKHACAKHACARAQAQPKRLTPFHEGPQKNRPSGGACGGPSLRGV